MALDPYAMKVITAATVRVFRCVRADGPKAKSAFPPLATTLKRPREAVSRDVAALRKIGLVDVRPSSNPGQGRVSMVTPLVLKILVEL